MMQKTNVLQMYIMSSFYLDVFIWYIWLHFPKIVPQEAILND